MDFEKGGEAYYPVNNSDSIELYKKYVNLAKEKYPNMILGGRLGAYQYWDMDKAIYEASKLAKSITCYKQNYDECKNYNNKDVVYR